MEIEFVTNIKPWKGAFGGWGGGGEKILVYLPPGASGCQAYTTTDVLFMNKSKEL